MIDGLGLTEALEPKLVTGENITQTLQFVDTGNAELGFVALSQVIGQAGIADWLPLGGLSTPILQDAVLLKDRLGPIRRRSRSSTSSRAPRPRMISASGYETE